MFNAPITVLHAIEQVKLLALKQEGEEGKWLNKLETKCSYYYVFGGLMDNVGYHNNIAGL
jgi:hypothetical protein